MSHDIFTETISDRNQLSVPPSEQDHLQGSLKAKVVLVEYGDYQCPQCGKLHALIQTIQNHLNAAGSKQNNLCYIFRHFPQPQIHPYAQKAAAAAEAAAAQEQFWQMHKVLLQHQLALSDGHLAEYAHNLGLDVTQFVRDIVRKVYADSISRDVTSGRHSGVISTPALFINGVRYRNALELEPLLAAIAKSNNSL